MSIFMCKNMGFFFLFWILSYKAIKADYSNETDFEILNLENLFKGLKVIKMDEFFLFNSLRC